MSRSAHLEPMEGHWGCFGVGCFHFAPRDQTQTFDPFEFSGDLREVLESVPIVSNLDWKELDAIRGLPPYHPVDIQRGPGLGFHPSPSELAFDIFVPQHLQEKMLYGPAGTNSEHFRVRLFYTYEFTVTIVEPLDNFTEHPSESVIVVRKCLEEYFAGIPDCRVCFQALGPSPFHANFFAGSEAGDDDEVKCTITNRPGYDRITYTVTGTDAAASANTREVVFKHVVEELSGFYYIIQVRNRLNHEWGEIEEGLDSIGQKALRRRLISTPWLSLRTSGDLQAM